VATLPHCDVSSTRFPFAPMPWSPDPSDSSRMVGGGLLHHPPPHFVVFIVLSVPDSSRYANQHHRTMTRLSNLAS
jgi:hypothetical protein